MDITFKALLALLILTTVWGPAEPYEVNYQTWVTNDSPLTIRASINYNGWWTGTPDFQNRIIAPGAHEGDTYLADNSGIALIIEAYPSCCWATIQLNIDDSVVALDSGDGGVNIFKVLFGTLNEPVGQSLAILYPSVFINPDGQPNNPLFCTDFSCYET